MGPCADQTRAFIVQPGQFNLQPALLGPRATSENLEDQAGAVDDLHLPRLFQIALLHRGQVVVDDHGLGVGGANQSGQLLDLA
ncbi:hypothetical protein D3C81_1905630 [compost metagenome]